MEQADDEDTLPIGSIENPMLTVSPLAQTQAFHFLDLPGIGRAA